MPPSFVCAPHGSVDSFLDLREKIVTAAPIAAALLHRYSITFIVIVGQLVKIWWLELLVKVNRVLCRLTAEVEPRSPAALYEG